MDRWAARAETLRIHAVPTLVLLDPAGDEVGRVTGVPSRSTLHRVLDDACARFGITTAPYELHRATAGGPQR